MACFDKLHYVIALHVKTKEIEVCVCVCIYMSLLDIASASMHKILTSLVI